MVVRPWPDWPDQSLRAWKHMQLLSPKATVHFCTLILCPNLINWLLRKHNFKTGHTLQLIQLGFHTCIREFYHIHFCFENSTTWHNSYTLRVRTLVPFIISVLFLLRTFLLKTRTPRLPYALQISPIDSSDPASIDSSEE